jgi:lipopolysaccharide biosynthesis protein
MASVNDSNWNLSRIKRGLRRRFGGQNAPPVPEGDAERELGIKASGRRLLSDWTPEQFIQEPQGPQVSLSERRIAVTGHLFYADYVEPFCAGVQRFPIPCDVLVTTPSSTIAHSLEEGLRGHGGSVEVRVTPNRGRNFGPLLVEFGERLGDYDLMTHVHSKRTPQGVPDLVNDWVLRQWEFGLLDPRLVVRTLSAIERDRSIALAYPNVSELLPPYAFGWLQNEPAARSWYGARGEQMPEGQIPFPAGGMFWARPSLIRRFLEQGPTYELFPEEAGQIDATYQHFLERLIGVEALERGSCHLVYCKNVDRYTTETSYVWSGYRHQSMNGVAERIEESSEITFSLFGTSRA